MKRVFILSSHPLFGKCIETLVGQDRQVQLVGHTKDPDVAIEQIKTLQPDVVIVVSKAPEAKRGKIMMQIMKEGLKIEVVGLNLSDNTVLICRGEQHTINEQSDFISLITSTERRS